MIINEIKSLISEADGTLTVSTQTPVVEGFGDSLSSIYTNAANWITGGSAAPVVAPRSAPSNFSVGRDIDNAVNSTVDSVNYAIDSTVDMANSASNWVVGAYNSTINYFTGVKNTTEEFGSWVDSTMGSGEGAQFSREVDKRAFAQWMARIQAKSEELINDVVDSTTSFAKGAYDASADVAGRAYDSSVDTASSIGNAVADAIQNKIQFLNNQVMMGKMVNAAPEEYREYIYKFYMNFGQNPVIEKLMELSKGDYKLFIALVLGAGVVLVGGFAGATYFAVKGLTTKSQLSSALDSATREMNSASTPEAKTRARAKVIAVGSKAIALAKLKNR